MTARASEDGRLYGSVSAQDVVEFLEKNQVPVEKRRIAARRPDQGARGVPGAGPAPRRRDGVADGLGRGRVARPARSSAMATTSSSPARSRRRASRPSGRCSARSCSSRTSSRAPSSSSSPPTILQGRPPKIFARCSALFERSEPADPSRVGGAAAATACLEEVGGHAALASLQEEGTVAPRSTAYTGIVREKALLREMIRVATRDHRAGLRGDGRRDKLLDDAER